MIELIMMLPRGLGGGRELLMDMAAVARKEIAEKLLPRVRRAVSDIPVVKRERQWRAVRRAAESAQPTLEPELMRRQDHREGVL